MTEPGDSLLLHPDNIDCVTLSSGVKVRKFGIEGVDDDVDEIDPPLEALTPNSEDKNICSTLVVTSGSSLS